MAVHLATSSDYLQRTTALLPASGNSTVSFWVNYGAISTAPAYQTSYIILDDPAVYTDYTGTFSNSSANTLDAAGQIVHATVASAATWYYYTWTQTGTTQRLYINGSLIGAVTKDRAAFVDGFELLGNDTFSDGNLSLAYCREWTVALNQTQILAELQATTAVHTANLYMDCPFTSTILDVSGNGHDWTQFGSATFVAGPTFPANSTAATATPISTLPQTITQDFGDGLYAWYSYTGHPSEVIAGFFAYADIAVDDIIINVYAADGTTLQLTFAANKPIQYPQTNGTLIYFWVHKVGSPPSTAVTFSGVPGPTSPVPVGSIFINDDAFTFPAAAIAPSGAGYSVLQFFAINSTNSENGGDVLDDGTVLLTDEANGTFDLYNGQLALQRAIAPFVASSRSIVKTCVGPQVWYAGDFFAGAGNKAILAKIAANGDTVQTWTLPSAGLTCMAASNDETVIYTIGVSLGTAVKQWLTGSSTFGADLAATVVNYTSPDMIVLSDDTILVIYVGASPHLPFVRRYAPDGSTVMDYALPTAGSDASLFQSLTPTTSFWIRVHNGTIYGIGSCTCYEIRLSDGALLNTVPQVMYNTGQYVPTATLTPLSRFGVSLSCPAFILREAILPPPAATPDPTLIRRERIFRHLSDEQQWIFYQWLQIDAEAGVGLSEGQGSDPQIILQWSDDGGHTWSNEHFLSAGKQGEYGKRSILKQPLGRSRDRVFKVAMSDPVKWALLNAYFGAEKGTS